MKNRIKASITEFLIRLSLVDSSVIAAIAEELLVFLV